MITIVNSDRKEYLQQDGTLTEAAGSSAHAFPLFHLLCVDSRKHKPNFIFQGLWAGQRITIMETEPGNLEGFTCLNGSFGLSD